MTKDAAQIAARPPEVTKAMEACASSLHDTHRLLGDLVATSPQIDGTLLVKIYSARHAVVEALQALSIAGLNRTKE